MLIYSIILPGFPGICLIVASYISKMNEPIMNISLPEVAWNVFLNVKYDSENAYFVIKSIIIHFWKHTEVRIKSTYYIYYI